MAQICCRTCGKEFTYPNDYLKHVKEGRLSFCFNCGEISAFTKELTLRAPTTKELANKVDWPIVKQYRKLIPSYRRKIS